MRVIICGSRTWTDERLLKQVIDDLREKDSLVQIIHGGARGADRLAGDYAKRCSLEVSEYVAQWGLYGKAAGPIRNKQMLDEGTPDLVIGFLDRPLRESVGTRNMLEQAARRGVPLRYYITGKGWFNSL